MSFSATGGWQTWKTETKHADIPDGQIILRVKVASAGFNLNWINFVDVTSIEEFRGDKRASGGRAACPKSGPVDRRC